MVRYNLKKKLKIILKQQIMIYMGLIKIGLIEKASIKTDLI